MFVIAGTVISVLVITLWMVCFFTISQYNEEPVRRFLKFLLPYFYHIIKVGGVSFRLVLVLHAPAVVGNLYGCLNGAVAVFAVQGVDGCCEACLLVAVDGVEEVGLYGVVGADVGDDDSGLLVEICGGVAPLGA